MKIVSEPFVILPAADVLADFGIERLHADLELQGAGRKLRDDLTQFSGQTVRNHLEMEKHFWLVARKEKFQQRLDGGELEFECAIHELELLQTAIQQPLHRREKFIQRHLPHRNVERRQAELAGERTAARRLDIDDAMRNVGVRVKIIRQGESGKLRQVGGDYLRVGDDVRSLIL